MANPSPLLPPVITKTRSASPRSIRTPSSVSPETTNEAVPGDGSQPVTFVGPERGATRRTSPQLLTGCATWSGRVSGMPQPFASHVPCGRATRWPSWRRRVR